MTTNGSSNDDDNKKPQAERVEVRRVEVADEHGRRTHVRVHHAYGPHGRRARLHLGWRVWLLIAVAGLIIVGVIALALTVLIWILPWLLIFVAALLLARWLQRLLGWRR